MVAIQTAGPDDAAVLASIMVQSFRAAFSTLVSVETLERCANEKNCTAMLEQVCKTPDMHAGMASVDGISCGEIFWSGEGELIALHTLPQVWGKGVGSALLEWAMTEMKSVGIEKMFLWAFRENWRARRFYEKHGLTASGAERISAFDGAAEIQYQKELKP